MYNHLNYLRRSENRLYTSAAAVLPSIEELAAKIQDVEKWRKRTERFEHWFLSEKKGLTDPRLTEEQRNYNKTALEVLRAQLRHLYLLLWKKKTEVTRLYNRLNAAAKVELQGLFNEPALTDILLQFTHGII